MTTDSSGAPPEFQISLHARSETLRYQEGDRMLEVSLGSVNQVDILYTWYLREWSVPR